MVVLVDFNTVVPFELEGGTTVGKSSELVACSCGRILRGPLALTLSMILNIEVGFSKGIA